MLEAGLEAIQAMARSRLPAEAQSLMQRSIDDLRASGILERVETLGASLAVISPQVRRAARETGNEPALRLRALCDRGNEVARRPTCGTSMRAGSTSSS